MEGTEHAEISSFPRLASLSPSRVHPSQPWHYQKDGILDIMCHVKSSYAFRTVKLLFILSWRAGHGAKRGRKAADESGGIDREGRKSEKQGRLASRRNHLATSNPLRTKLPSYHRASCQDARRLYTNANECGTVSGLMMPPPPSLFLSFAERGRANFVIVGTEDSRAQPKTFSRAEIRRWLFSMLTSFLLKIRSPVKIE